MFGKPIRLFRMFGFTVSMDWSWLILATLIVWSLAEGVFRVNMPGMSSSTYWLMGVAGAAGLFVSIVFHELWHSLVARRYGLPMKGITLFIFGGVAEMTEEPANAKTEFLMAIAGPASSVALAGVLFGVWGATIFLGAPAYITGVLLFLWTINLVLVAFNMIPAFPLDGGRVLRSALWGWRKDLRWATRLASQFGSAFGIALIVLGVVEIIMGGLISGVWWLLIGWFVRSAARQSYQQVIMRQALQGEPVRRFMNPSPVTIPPTASLQELVEQYVYRYGYALFPVTVAPGAPLMGCISVQQVKQIPREHWANYLVQDLMTPPSSENTVHPETDAVHLLGQMRSSGQSRVMVVEEGRLVGVITLKDLLHFLALKIELEEGPSGPPAIRLAGDRRYEEGLEEPADLEDEFRRRKAG